jgi:hypothetical protein
MTGIDRVTGLLVLGLAAASASPGRAGAQAPPADPVRCLGVQSGASPALPFLDPIRVDLGSLVLVLEGDISPHDSAYVVNLVTDLLPEMSAVLGQNGGGAEPITATTTSSRCPGSPATRGG